MTSQYKEIVSNRRAFHNYEILKIFEAGIVLLGTEVKSLRNHGGSLNEAYVLAKKREAWLIGANIATYKFGNINNHNEKRSRKLLLHKKELQELAEYSQQKGFSLIPLGLILKNGLFKVRIGYAKGKKLHDKRRALIEKEKKIEIARVSKYNR